MWAQTTIFPPAGHGKTRLIKFTLGQSASTKEAVSWSFFTCSPFLIINEGEAWEEVQLLVAPVGR